MGHDRGQNNQTKNTRQVHDPTPPGEIDGEENITNQSTSSTPHKEAQKSKSGEDEDEDEGDGNLSFMQ